MVTSKLKKRNGFTNVHMLRNPFRQGVQMANETSFVMLVNVLEEVSNKSIKPVTVSFNHPSDHKSSFEDYFECEVLFNQNDNILQFRTSDLETPTLKADESIHRYLLQRMDEEKEGIHSNTDQLLLEIHGLVKNSLPSGVPSVIQVAEYLNLSARTLKRRLSDKDLTFRDFVQNIQKEVALELLRNTDQTIGEIAFLTGFSEQSAFKQSL